MANDVVHDVKLAKVNTKVLLAALKSLGVTPEKKDPATLVKALVEYEKKNKPAKIGECDVCGGSSSADFDACPFCGTGGDEETEAEEKPAAEEQPPAPKKEKAAKAPKEEAPPAEKKTAKGSKKSAKTTEEKTEEKAVEAVVEGKPTTALAKVDKPGAVVKYNVDDLDKTVSAINTLKSAIWSNGWKMGKLITELRDKQLWKLRNEDGKPKYLTFESFCKSELGFSDNQAYRLMDVAERFTEEQVKKFGTTKLSLILEAPKEDQDKILEEHVAKNASSAEVREAVTKARKEKGVTRRDTGRKKTPKSGKAASPPKKKAKGASPKRDKITVAALEGTKTVKLFKREHPEVVAKRIADEPVGTLELENDVVMHFSLIQGPEGNIVLKIRTKREG